MVIPKIKFVWSYIYQEEIHGTSLINYDRTKSKNYVEIFLDKIKEEWNERKEQILLEMASCCGLNWPEITIPCYVIEQSIHGPISEPLTIPIQLQDDGELYELSPTRFVDMLTHELIHVLFIQHDKVDQYFDYIVKKYTALSENAAAHIIVHAIHKHIFLTVFNQERLDEEIEASSWYPDYKAAWDIVEEQDYKVIIDEFKQKVQ